MSEMTSEFRSEWTSPDTWRDPDCIECDGEGAPCCEPPDHPYSTREWLSASGGLIQAPADARTCSDTTGAWRTHYLFGTGQPTLMQALTLCGRRAGAIPGTAVVNCDECLSAARP